jgi:biopolymer transport protein ExbB/TolQ
MTLSLVLDIVVAVLLLATIAYAMTLSRRLGALRDDKAQLEALVRSLDQSSRRAEAGIAALKTAADEIGRELQEKVDRGQALRTDLGYILELAGGLADRLEGAIRSGRGEAKTTSSVADAAEPPANRGERVGAVTADPGDRQRVTGFPSRAERMLRRALEARS